MTCLIQNVLKKYNKNIWVMYNNENSDRIFCKYFTKHLASNTICIISTQKVYIILSSLDKDNVEKLKYDPKKVQFFSYKSRDELDVILENIIADLNFSNKICLNFSTMSDRNTDIMSHGDYVYLTKILKKPYLKYKKKVKFESAEKMIYDLESRKTEKEINRLKLLADITNRILEETFKKIQIGDNEIQIVNKTKRITDEIMKLYVDSNDIVSYDMAWENCPIVLTGINLAKGGHSLPSTKKLFRGDTIYFDFGIKATFSDEMVLYTDMQRMGYALKKNEFSPPKQVMKVFNTLVNSISDGIDEMRPGVKAYKVDKVVRDEIIKAGYPEYNHATGHPVGKEVHDIGAIISIKKSKLANLELIENGVYTLEPRVNISNGGSIEEMIQVTKYGGVPLTHLQDEIYLVK